MVVPQVPRRQAGGGLGGNGGEGHVVSGGTMVCLGGRAWHAAETRGRRGRDPRDVVNSVGESIQMPVMQMLRAEANDVRLKVGKPEFWLALLHLDQVGVSLQMLCCRCRVIASVHTRGQTKCKLANLSSLVRSTGTVWNRSGPYPPDPYLI